MRDERRRRAGFISCCVCRKKKVGMKMCTWERNVFFGSRLIRNAEIENKARKIPDQTSAGVYQIKHKSEASNLVSHPPPTSLSDFGIKGIRPFKIVEILIQKIKDMAPPRCV